jgi:ABC-type transport system substrate-binding protein
LRGGARVNDTHSPEIESLELTVDQLELARSLPNVHILTVPAAQTLVCRMQVDTKPFDDIRVRRAVLKASNNPAIHRLVFGNLGSVGNTDGLWMQAVCEALRDEVRRVRLNPPASRRQPPGSHRS